MIRAHAFGTAKCSDVKRNQMNAEQELLEKQNEVMERLQKKEEAAE